MNRKRLLSQLGNITDGLSEQIQRTDKVIKEFREEGSIRYGDTKETEKFRGKIYGSTTIEHEDFSYMVEYLDKTRPLKNGRITEAMGTRMKPYICGQWIDNSDIQTELLEGGDVSPEEIRLLEYPLRIVKRDAEWWD